MRLDYHSPVTPPADDAGMVVVRGVVIGWGIPDDQMSSVWMGS